MATNDLTINYNDIVVKNFAFTQITPDKNNPARCSMYPRYKSSSGKEIPIFIQMPWVNMSMYGVPSFHPQHYKDEASRRLIKIPLDESVSELKPFLSKIHEMDEFFSSDAFRNTFLLEKIKQAKSFTYQSIFRLPQEEITLDDSKAKKSEFTQKLPFMKLKIDTSYGSGEILTIIYDSEIVDEKRVRTRVNDLADMDAVRKAIPWRSRIHPIIRPVKMWIDLAQKKYGLTFKMVKVEVESAKNGENYREYAESDLFLNEDNDDVKNDTKNEDTNEDKNDENEEHEASNAVQSNKKVENIAEVDSDGDGDADEVIEVSTQQRTPVPVPATTVKQQSAATKTTKTQQRVKKT